MKVKLKTDVMKTICYREIPKDIVLAYRRAMFEQRELPDTTIKYRTEEKLFNCIRQGEPDRIEESLKELSEGDRMMGCMSMDPLRQAQYTFISGLTLATRCAIEGGLPEIEAYNLSDVYAQKADVSKRIEEIWQLAAIAYYDFARRVQLVRRRKAYSYPITLCISYILDHLHYQITLTELSKVCKLTPQYLSALFHKETRMTVTEYIMKEKLETARQMLTYSEHTVQEIASFLGFCSHSSFTAHFRKTYGITPREYRNSSGTYHPELH